MRDATLFLLVWVAAAEKSSCPNHADASLGGSALLMKDTHLSKKKEVLEGDEADEQMQRVYTPYRSGKALDYFMRWAQGSVENKVSRELVQMVHGVMDPASLVMENSDTSMSRITSIYAAAEQEICGESRLRSWSLVEKTESSGVEHVLVRSEKTGAKKFQYLAVHHEKILVADPPIVCMVQSPDLKSEDPPSIGGDDDLLDPNTDEMVKDCKKLFERTAADICQKKMEVKVLSATRRIIDGFEVDMEVEVTGPQGKTTHHSPTCLFETSSDHTDASLLQKTDPAESDPTEEEKSGLVATLRMHTELCKADTEDGSATSSEDVVAFGELSLYKGFEHVNDGLARITVPLEKGAPSQVDHRKMYPECFPMIHGKEVVRNQGQCGSCWAFATASAAMNNLCVSDHGAKSLAAADNRYEVSVQEIMSCNDPQRGCQGGNAEAAHTAMVKTNGPAKERSYPYKCGSGDPHNHFDQSSGNCDAAPWGANCATSGASVPGWMWSGVSVVSGEDSMKALIADANSLYASMAVYGNFMSHTTGVYSTLAGGKKGGHAMVAMGYGTEGGTPYWLLQNSWGPAGWGEDGYGKVLRGSNLAGIEDNAFWIKAWVSGGKEPECSDGANSGLSAGGGMIACSDATNFHGTNLCTDPSWGASVKKNCPKTCNSCQVWGNKDGSGGGSAPGPSPGPPPPPAPTPEPPAPPPADECLVDRTSVFRGRYPCVIQNQCSTPVNFQCTTSRCSTFTVGAGRYTLLKCGGQWATDFCDNPDQCHMV